MAETKLLCRVRRGKDNKEKDVCSWDELREFLNGRDGYIKTWYDQEVKDAEAS